MAAKIANVYAVCDGFARAGANLWFDSDNGLLGFAFAFQILAILAVTAIMAIPGQPQAI